MWCVACVCAPWFDVLLWPFSFSIEGALICLQPYPESDTFPDLIPMFRSLGVGGGCGSRDLNTNHLLLGALS